MFKQMKLFIWGTGTYSKLVYQSLKHKKMLMGFIDNDLNKQGQLWNGKYKIYNPESIKDMEYDVIIISVREYGSVVLDCKKYCIPSEKIIAFFQLECDNDYIDLRNRKILELEERCSIYEAQIENLPYELGIGEFPIIKSSEELLMKVLREKKSVTRFGDGEFEIMKRRERSWFQVADDMLSNRLNEIIQSNEEKCLIAVADNFGNLDYYTEKAANDIRLYLKGKRNEIVDLIGTKKIYYNAYVSRPYMMYKNKSYAPQIFDLFKQIWAERNLLIVEGEYSRIGVNNDLLDTAKHIKRIICPYKNCFSVYQKILDGVLANVYEKDLIIVSLGATATVLAFDLTRLGYQCIDIGQLDTEYEWFKKNVLVRSPVYGKGVAEVKYGRIPMQTEDMEYNDQIVDVVS